MRRLRSWAGFLIVSLLGIVLCCGLPLSPLLYDMFIYPQWVSLVAPHPNAITIDAPRRVATLDSDVYDLRWSADGQALQVSYRHSYAEGEPMFLRTIAQDTGATLADKLMTETMSECDESALGCCPSQGLMLRSPAGMGAQYFLVSLRQNRQLLRTFTLNPIQSQNNYVPEPRTAVFSPDCTKAAIIVSGWAGYEAYGQEEVWLLDIPTQTLTFAFLSRKPAWAMWDYPVQSTRPSWSPDGREFVYGDAEFGLEIYTLQTAQHRWLAAPAHAGLSPLWSPTGKWIVARDLYNELQRDRLVVLSPDGKQHVLSPECAWINEVMWAPAQDQLAYFCQERGSEEWQLYIWELP